jgi:hypothetical protein
MPSELFGQRNCDFKIQLPEEDQAKQLAEDSICATKVARKQP